MSASLFEELKRRNVFRVGVSYLVLAWIVIQVTSIAVPALHLPDWVNSLVFYFGLIGFPFALFFAWAFEITPDGIKREADVDRSQSISPQTGRYLDYTIIALLSVALLYFVWESRFEADNLTQPEVAAEQTSESISKVISIAVLAFENMSSDKEQSFFSDGISEEILNVLVKVPGLDVSSRTSSFQFKGRDIGIPAIAKELKVRYVVEGSVRKAGDNIRVTAQLIDSTNDKHLWSDTYDRPLNIENVFVIQDEIAGSIVQALSNVLGTNQVTVKVDKSTNNLDAYELYLKARTLFHARIDLDIADQLLIRAIDKDANFSKAWGIRSALQSLMVEYGYSDNSIETTDKLTTEYAKRAIDLNPNSATAYAAMGLMMYNSNVDLRTQYDWEEIFELYEKALLIEPTSASALNWQGLSYLSVGKLDAALDSFKQCIEHEPHYTPCVDNQMVMLGYMGTDEEAVKAFLDALDEGLVKLDQASYFLPLLARLNKELVFKSVTNLQTVLFGWRRHDELYDAYRNPEEIYTDLITDIKRFSETNRVSEPTYLRMILLYIGDYDALPFTLFMWDKSLYNYRQSPQFHSFIKKSNVLKYWQNNGFPKQCKPQGNGDFYCD